MARPDPIQYADRLYGAIRAANFSPISFLAFGNAIKDGVSMRNMPRIAAEPFMRVVGEMLDLEEEAEHEEIIVAAIAEPETDPSASTVPGSPNGQSDTDTQAPVVADRSSTPPAAASEKRRGRR